MLLYHFLVCKKKYIYIEIAQQVKQIQAVKKMNVKEPTKRMCTQCNKLYSIYIIYTSGGEEDCEGTYQEDVYLVQQALLYIYFR